tara:strand:+ start:1097 stop:1324 length:228 start_codon:yes stop_codon:yes gene_type:complete
MVGYKYNTEAEAINARKLSAEYKGLPIRPNDVTIYWVDYTFSELDNFYYIEYVDELENVLGEPIEINITLPIMPD